MPCRNCRVWKSISRWAQCLAVPNVNFASYGHMMGAMSDDQRALLCDPQTSGGLLIAVTPDAEDAVHAAAAEFGINLTAIGELVTARGGRPMIELR
ncbi:Selenide, water dikinase [Kluyvera intermedia]|nr:Selenide, water dikinase [Kluyvera intermedia]